MQNSILKSAPARLVELMREQSSKIQREVRRLMLQAALSPHDLFWFLFGTRISTVLADRSLRLFDGGCDQTNRIAIYAIYPKAGVTCDHLSSIEYLRSAGYSPLIVSNLKLSDSQRDLILPISWKLLERRNVGYDFGAYRCALIFLHYLTPRLSYVALFNDSCVFPAPGSKSWLTQAEGANLDLVSPIVHAGSGWQMAILQGGPLNRVILSRKHYCSYALLFSSKIINSPEFSQFWKKIKLANSKRLTVRWGERALTRWVEGTKFAHGSTIGLTELAFLLKTSEGETFNGDPSYAAGAQLLREFGHMFIKKRSVVY